MAKDKRGTWPQALLTFFTPLVLIALLRWLIIEPFVIPSGSMIPTLLVHDHIFVNKLSYGIRYPFSKKYLIRWNLPKVGEIIVFRN
jgi:signal peptidase I